MHLDEFYRRQAGRFSALLGMAQENADAGFDLARELSSVQTPSEYIEVWSAWARSAYGTLSEQAKELSALAQR